MNLKHLPHLLVPANFFNELSTQYLSITPLQKKKNLCLNVFAKVYFFIFFLHFIAVRYNNFKLCLPCENFK